MGDQVRSTAEVSQEAIRPPAVDTLAARLRTIYRDAQQTIERLNSVNFIDRRETRASYGEIFARCRAVFRDIAGLDGGKHSELQMTPVDSAQTPNPPDSLLVMDLRALQTSVALMLEAMDRVWPQK